ncbi:MAG: hypothetical protein Q9187_007754, partial [Circinaria calcarea]
SDFSDEQALLAGTEFDEFFREETELWDAVLPPQSDIQQAFLDHWNQSMPNNLRDGDVDEMESSVDEDDFEGDTSDNDDEMDIDNTLDEDIAMCEELEMTDLENGNESKGGVSVLEVPDSMDEEDSNSSIDYNQLGLTSSAQISFTQRRKGSALAPLAYGLERFYVRCKGAEFLREGGWNGRSGNGAEESADRQGEHR